MSQSQRRGTQSRWASSRCRRYSPQGPVDAGTNRGRRVGGRGTRGGCSEPPGPTWRSPAHHGLGVERSPPTESVPTARVPTPPTEKGSHPRLPVHGRTASTLQSSAPSLVPPITLSPRVSERDRSGFSHGSHTRLTPGPGRSRRGRDRASVDIGLHDYRAVGVPRTSFSVRFPRGSHPLRGTIGPSHPPVHTRSGRA